MIAALGIAGWGAWFDGHLQRGPALPDYPGRPPTAGGTTWLLVGSDSREQLSAAEQQRLSTGGDLGIGHTDTLLLVRLPALGADVPATVVSIPRDSYLPIPGYGPDKVNVAFALGGAPLLMQTVEQATGLRLDHYAEVGLAGFAALADALGGVSVCPDQPISDPLAGLDLPAGCQRLDGRSALGYVRTRSTPRADLDRMQHQRLFVSALVRRLSSPTVWLNPWRWFAVSRAAGAAVVIDADAHAWDLGRLLWTLHRGSVDLTVPISGFTSTDAGDVVLWDQAAADELFTALRRDAPLPQPLPADPG